MNRGILAMGTLVLALAAGFGGAFAQNDPIAQRKALMKAIGDANRAPAAMLKGEPFELPKVQAALTDEAAFKAIKEGFKDKDGKTLMKPSEGLSDDDIKGIVKHLRTFKK